MAEYRRREVKKKIKFMQSLPPEPYKILKREARKRGKIPIQQLIRAVIIPDWLEHEKSLQKTKE